MLDYHGSARFDDQLEVALRCGRVGTSSIVFQGEIFRGTQRLVSGELVYVFADPVSQTARPVPQALRDVFSGFEAGQAMQEVAVGDWQTLAQGARALRREVFVQEQQIPIEMEQDDADADAVHVLVRNRLGLPIATGRLLQPAADVGQIGRLAVNRLLRGSHFGRMALQALLAAADSRGDREVMLHAQSSVQGFYAAQGFSVRGAPFVEAGIAHIEMVRALK